MQHTNTGQAAALPRLCSYHASSGGKPTRRNLLAALGASTALATVPAAARAADAELAAIGREAAPLVAEYDRYLGMFFALDYDDPDLDRVARLGDPAGSRLDALTDRATNLRATTWEGHVAKARLLHHGLLMSCGTTGVFDPKMADAETLLAWSLVNDMLGSVGA